MCLENLYFPNPFERINFMVPQYPKAMLLDNMFHIVTFIGYLQNEINVDISYKSRGFFRACVVEVGRSLCLIIF